MNKKLLFAAVSLAALTACSTDDFQGQGQNVAEGTSSVQFEVVNNVDDLTRASMNGNKIVWNANDGDLFTLYHGGANATGYQNATYTAVAGESGSAAKLSTPSMILPGTALMVWPVDTIFTNDGSAPLAISIPAEQKADIENSIPYVSDLITINLWAANSGKYNEAGYNRMYPVYMRPMGSQLIINADYAGTDNTLKQLYAGGTAEPAEGGINPIEVTSMELLTGGGTTPSTSATPFTTKVPLSFAPATAADNTRWNTTAATKVANNNWTAVTGFGTPDAATAVDQLTTKCLIANNGGAKFLVLPQAAMTTPGSGVDDGAVVVRTNYGKVIVAQNNDQSSQYDTSEEADAWYRYIPTSATGAAASAQDGETKAGTATAGKGYKTTAKVEMGLKQFFETIRTYTHTGVSPVQTEPEGAAGNRYVKVLLKYLDMSDLHINNDKWLRDAAYVWKHMGAGSVTVFLDGDSKKEFAISQTTIAAINAINAAAALEATPRSFSVKPCQTTGEICNTIVVTGGDNVQDMAFITANGTFKADVALKAGETWKWGKADKVIVPSAGVKSIINRGTLVSDATATLKTQEAPRATGTQNNVPFVNDGTWNITAGTLNVQFDVTNNGTVNISAGAQYRQDGNAGATVFTNEATAKPKRFGGDDKKIGVVNNKGVFATVATISTNAIINNYGLIEHADKDAKTYVTTNQTTGAAFNAAFSTTNKMGRINLPYSNKDEDNISVNAGLSEGFISVTVDGEVTGALAVSALGTKVNYLIIKSGPTSIASMTTTPPGQVKYLEVNMTDKSELAWSVSGTQTFTGLMVLSDVNIKLGTTITVTGATYLGSDMYVGGTFNQGAWTGYYGNTSSNVATKYITY